MAEMAAIEARSMKIDEFLPRYDDFSTFHMEVLGKAESAYLAYKQIDFSESRIISFLVWLRGLNIHNLNKSFTPLADDPPREVVLGLIAKPWARKKALLPFKTEDFKSFSEPGYAKIAWNFSFSEKEGKTRIATETRILCTDSTSRRKFRLYWFFVKPFSGLIRLEILRLIKKNAH